jgi:predicted MFS family arabinose efflux permease
VFLLVLLLGVLSVIIDPSSAVLFGASMFVITWANQTVLSANQARTLAANPVQSAQANTVFMFAVFLGGSAGAFTGTVAFSAGGMPLVGVQAGAFVLIALVIWFASATHQKRTTPNPGKKRITA